MSDRITAEKVGSTLVASFPSANPPLVWRFDLERNHTFTLALQGDDGEWELGMTSQKGEFYPVARFNHREEADLAMQKIERVLMRRSGSWKQRFLWFFAIVGVVLILFTFYSRLIGTSHPSPDARMGYIAPQQRQMPIPDLSGSDGRGETPSGVPLSADDVLRGVR